MALGELMLEVGTFLATPVIMIPLVEIDLWSGVHFIFGMLIIIGLFKYKSLKKYRRSPFKFALALIVLYEIGEVIVWSNPEFFNNIVPMPENSLNIWWDIIVGMLGALFQIRRNE